MTILSTIGWARSTPEKKTKVDWHFTTKQIMVELVMVMAQVAVADKDKAMVVETEAKVKGMVVMTNI
jgi:hypothetical protein